MRSTLTALALLHGSRAAFLGGTILATGFLSGCGAAAGRAPVASASVGSTVTSAQPMTTAPATSTAQAATDAKDAKATAKSSATSDAAEAKSEAEPRSRSTDVAEGGRDAEPEARAPSFAELTAALGDERLQVNTGKRAAQAPIAMHATGDHGAVGSLRQATASTATQRGPVSVSKGLAANAVHEAVQARSGMLRACYERGLAHAPQLAGRVTVTFDVDERGEPEEVSTDATFGDRDVVGCVRDVFVGMTFPRPTAAPVHVVYPVELRQE